MSSGVIQCADGSVTVSFDGAPLCSGVWTLVPVPEPFDLTTYPPEILFQAWGVGFFVVGTCWVIGKSFQTVLAFIKKL